MLGDGVGLGGECVAPLSQHVFGKVQREGVGLLGAIFCGSRDGPVEGRESRAVLDTGISLSVEVRDVGVGHVEVATDADAEVTFSVSTGDANAQVNKTIRNSN